MKDLKFGKVIDNLSLKLNVDKNLQMIIIFNSFI